MDHFGLDIQDMYNPQLHPLQVNPVTGEPFLRLPSPLDNIIITPPRIEDASSTIPILNDLSVCSWLAGPPYPYYHSHAISWLTARKEETDALLQELGTTHPDRKPRFVEVCPVRHLREVQNDGTDTFLGDIGFRRCLFEGEEAEEKSRLSEENAARKAGDPNIVWCVGYFLASSHHGRGIMSVALQTLLTAWAVPRMGVRKIRTEAFVGNIGSVRVFEKNGFVLAKTVDKVETTNCGTRQEGIHILLREFK